MQYFLLASKQAEIPWHDLYEICGKGPHLYHAGHIERRIEDAKWDFCTLRSCSLQQ